MCKVGKRCHVNAEGHKTFGTKFTPDLVRRLASSSIQIVSRAPFGAKGGTRQLLASGTLIAPNVVLCAGHSLQGLNAKDLSFVLFFECDAKTAPKGEFEDTPTKAPEWRKCTKLAEKRQGTCQKILETNVDYDYALLAVRWIGADYRYGGPPGVRLIQTPVGGVDVQEVAEDLEDELGTGSQRAADSNAAMTLRVPRPLTVPRPGSELTQELLLIGHPYSSQAGEQGQCQPTQASVGALAAKNLDDPTGPRTGVGGRGYAAASFHTYHGASGGGVFNERGELVGVLKGSFGNGPGVKRELLGKYAFLHLTNAASALGDLAKAGKGRDAPRLRQWIGGGAPRLADDPDADIDFKPQRQFTK